MVVFLGIPLYIVIHGSLTTETNQFTWSNFKGTWDSQSYRTAFKNSLTLSLWTSVVGAVFGLEWLGVDRIVSSPLNVGGGMVHSAHGQLPVPAPATVRLLGSTPVYSGTVQQELVTPTGALIVSSYADSFGPLPAMTIETR